MLPSWLTHWPSPTLAPRPRRDRRARRRLALEHLEDRTVPSSIAVTTTDDILGLPSAVSLRDAVRWANSQPGDNTVIVPEGTYVLTRTGIGEDAALTGDLDVTDTIGTLTIVGEGAGKTVIDANRIDRVFDIPRGAKLVIRDATIRGGSAFNGGGFYNRGDLTIENCNVESNWADARGGGIENESGWARLTVTGSSFLVNVSGLNESMNFGLGGAINNTSGFVNITGSLFWRNSAGTSGSGGAINTWGGGTMVAGSTFEENRAGEGGAAPG